MEWGAAWRRGRSREIAERTERSGKHVCVTCVCTAAFPLWKAVWNGKRNHRSRKFVAFLFARTIHVSRSSPGAWAVI